MKEMERERERERGCKLMTRLQISCEVIDILRCDTNGSFEFFFCADEAMSLIPPIRKGDIGYYMFSFQ